MGRHIKMIRPVVVPVGVGFRSISFVFGIDIIDTLRGFGINIRNPSLFDLFPIYILLKV
jgi:hypothetical protein